MNDEIAGANERAARDGRGIRTDGGGDEDGRAFEGGRAREGERCVSGAIETKRIRGRQIGDGAGGGDIDDLIGGPSVRVVSGVGETDDLATRIRGGEGAATDRGPRTDDASGIIGRRGGDRVGCGDRPTREGKVDRGAGVTRQRPEGKEVRAFNVEHRGTDIGTDARGASVKGRTQERLVKEGRIAARREEIAPG